jgi:phosphoglycolate phosphatase-like HAD superfamily hydrolase
MWFVGDSPRDVAAGRRARELLDGVELRLVAITGGRGTPDDLAAAGADAAISALAEILELLP